MNADIITHILSFCRAHTIAAYWGTHKQAANSINIPPFNYTRPTRLSIIYARMMNPLFFTQGIGESLFDWAIANNEHHLMEELKGYYVDCETNKEILDYLSVKKKVYSECITLLYLLKISSSSWVNEDSFDDLHNNPIKYILDFTIDHNNKTKVGKLRILCSIYDDIDEFDYNILSTNPLFVFVELLVKENDNYNSRWLSKELNEYGKLDIIYYFNIGLNVSIVGDGDDRRINKLNNGILADTPINLLNLSNVLCYGHDTPLMRSIIDTATLTKIEKTDVYITHGRYSNMELRIYAYKKHKIPLTSYDFIHDLYTVHRHYARKHLKFIFSRENCPPDNVEMVDTIKKIIKIVRESCDVDTARLIGEYCHWKTYTFREHIDFINGLKICGYLL